MPEPEPLISYILSCHGNQGQYILDHYKEFQSYVRKKTKAGSTLRKMPGFLLDIMVENNRNIVHNKSKYKKV